MKISSTLEKLLKKNTPNSKENSKQNVRYRMKKTKAQTNGTNQVNQMKHVTDNC